ncbi:MAG: hypothetical protein LAT82_00405 [Nanoarchaeota archaeon]|nr:hypothetical protein [Nanoarchaeota archaeon]
MNKTNDKTTNNKNSSNDDINSSANSTKVNFIEFLIQYPYELSDVLNKEFNEQEKVSNYTSLLTDKDRFENMMFKISALKIMIEELVGVEFPDSQEIFVIRAELFNSVPTPLIIEYQIHPEKMVLCTLKEMIKNVLGQNGIRCIDEVQQEELLLATLISISNQVLEHKNIQLQPFISWMIENSKNYLEQKGFELNENNIENYSISKENTLVSIIEESYNSLY